MEQLATISRWVAPSLACQVWVSFSGVTRTNTNFICPALPGGTGEEAPYISDLATDGTPWAPTVRLSIGGKNVPDPAPADSSALHYYNMVQALGYSPNITRDDYFLDSFAVCFDLKRVKFDHGSALSTRSGDQIRITVKNMDQGAADMMHVTLFAYGARESGCVLLN